jgi:uncharacterized protein YidB (DUF937 family)
MLDKIMDLVKDQALEAITNNAGVPAEKREAAVETTTSSILDGFKDQLTPGNITNLLGLFGGNSNASNALTSSIQSSVVSALAQKVGLDKNVANGIASTVIPAIMGLISKKNDDPNDSFDLGDILQSALGGGNDSKENKGGGGLLDMIGGLFGGGK